MAHRTQHEADKAERLASNMPWVGDRKWIGASEYVFSDERGWVATGRSAPGWTNTPHAGEPEGSRDRKPAEPVANPISQLYDKARLLDAAKETVTGRGKNYGTPEDNFARIACHWETFILNAKGTALDITPGDVAIMMALMKIARLENDPKHADSWIDLAGYAACGAEIETAGD